MLFKSSFGGSFGDISPTTRPEIENDGINWVGWIKMKLDEFLDEKKIRCKSNAIFHWNHWHVRSNSFGKSVQFFKSQLKKMTTFCCCNMDAKCHFTPLFTSTRNPIIKHFQFRRTQMNASVNNWGLLPRGGGVYTEFPCPPTLSPMEIDWPFDWLLISHIFFCALAWTSLYFLITDYIRTWH